MRNLLFFSILLLTACGDSGSSITETETKTGPSATVPKPVERWQSDTTLTTVESVYYDDAGQRFFVSNIEAGPWEFDGQGSIGILNLDGTVENARWVTGLNAPKGMGLHDGKLYAADLNAVVEIDVATGTLTARHAIEGATGLNDIDIAADGTIYVSDSKTGKVHRGRPGAWTTVVEGMGRPNGVLVTSGGILLGDTGNKNLSRLLPDGKREILVKGVEPDGIVALRDGGYIVSRWGGEIHHISADWKANSIFTSPDEKDKTADIAYWPEENVLLVPTFFGNRVVAYDLE